MTKISKYIKLNPNVLMDWTFDNENYNSYPYKIITNINENKKRLQNEPFSFPAAAGLFFVPGCLLAILIQHNF